MSSVTWQGVYPAATTQFKSDQSLDLAATAGHVNTLIDAGVHGLVMLGTLGENTALEPAEKRDVLKAALEAAGGRVLVLTGVAECSTAQACRYAEDAKTLGVDGLMVLPAMVYKSDGRETMAHFRAVARATDLPVMCYNNPVSYGVDITPEMFADLADEPTLVAIKESSDDVRRLTDLANACGERYVLFCGVDDLIVESVLLGVTGWVAGTAGSCRCCTSTATSSWCTTSSWPRPWRASAARPCARRASRSRARSATASWRSSRRAWTPGRAWPPSRISRERKSESDSFFAGTRRGINRPS
jgi:4-hydroxy-tetrahydrodipicolinate synthase